MDELNDQMDQPTAVLKAIQFDLMTSADMEISSSATVIKGSDVTSAKLGLPAKATQCETCGSESSRDCDGHSGVIKLPATVFSPYFIKEVVQLLNQICPGCCAPRKNRDSKNSDGGTSQSTCKYCSKDGAKLYPSVIFKALKSPRVTLSRKKIKRDPTVIDTISITAEVAYRVKNTLTNEGPHQALPQDYWGFIPHDHDQLPQPNVTKILLSPHQVCHMLKQLDPEIINNNFPSSHHLLFLSSLRVTPNCHRVAEMPYRFSDGSRLAYDDLTKAYKRTVDVGRKVDDFHQYPKISFLSLVTSQVMECLKSSKLHSKKTDNESSIAMYGMKWMKDAVLSKRMGLRLFSSCHLLRIYYVNS
ncbi:DNA-directed RNA polymerase IV subunit 1-like [Lolium rigidum]|uniref:DNA-directed RNA polymerase IV subunit 1-like n=1 Tax=Lolium rigidum TaxID=89674 RepID=UPI001F5D22BB|nr:DNA-directed RNA polymerase IV subunit 1-like [Lolium rigidum]